jgi:signal transduction histidine kinase/ActR/RegA family two-component response regulator
VQEALSLLRYPSPTADQVQSALGILLALPAELPELPQPGEQLEQALFQAAASIYRDPDQGQQARAALRHALGARRSEQALTLLIFVQTEQTTCRLQPDLQLEPDLAQLLAAEPDLAELLDERRQSGRAAPTQAQVRQDRRPPAGAAQEERDAQRDLFIDMLAHELRNPVATISAVSDMFQVVGIADDRLRNASNILHRQTRLLTRMVDNLNDVSNLAFGKATITKAPVAIDDVVAAMLQTVAPRMKEKGLALRLLPTDRRAYVLGERARLIQLFENIFSNLEKIIQAPATVRVSVGIEEEFVRISFAEEGGLAVREAGSGAAAAGLKAQQGLARRDGGFGLGMMIAQVIAELHGGHLQMGGPGMGARCSVTLPALKQESAPVSSEKKPAPHDRPRMRVLAIEDNRDFAQLFRHMLEIMGCELDITSDARSGLQIAHDVLPELIFCDIGLPGDMNGFDFARAVRADSRLSHIPLVAVSGYSSQEDRERALGAGFDRVCAKPVKFADISEVLARVAGRQRTGR